MKRLKGMISALLAAVMVLAMSMTAFAATVTISDDDILKGHTFTAYQVFKGDEADDALSNVEWGTGINHTDFLKTLKADATYGSKFSACETAADVAKVLGENNGDKDFGNRVAELAYANKTDVGTTLTTSTTELVDGYYLVVDTTANVGASGAYNKALLQVVGNINITAKTDAPSVEKKVLENVKYNQNGGYGNQYNDVADYNMGDAVPFKLIGTVPDMSNYKTYKYIFHDTMSAGLTLNETSIKVYVSSDKAGTDKTEITGWNKAVNGQSFTVSFADLKSVAGVSAGKFILVEYTAILNQNAVVGLDGNPNVVYLEYSNKPDHSGAGDTDNTGNTPEDKVIVFTYELDTTKVDGQDNSIKLEGAEFKLHNAGNKWAIVNADSKVTGWADTEADGTTLKSDANGLFKVIGLDDGTYYLKETKAPAGYNLLTKEIEVVIKATTSNGQTWTNGVASDALTALDVTADGKAGTGDVNTGIAGITIANNKGSVLPETGGMGTTIFYVVGTILVLGAAVVMITRKRMSVDK